VPPCIAMRSTSAQGTSGQRPALRAPRSNSPVSVAGSDVRANALSRSVALLEELYQALAITDPRELETTRRWIWQEHRAVEESYGASA